MKNITKLINGSIVVFVICLIAVLTLTSCDNTNDNLRKGQDTNITEVQGDEYQVTEKEFEKSIDFTKIEHYIMNGKFYTYDKNTNSEVAKGEIKVERLTEDLLQADFYQDGIITSTKTFNAKEYNPLKQLDYTASDFKYNQDTKCYDAELYYSDIDILYYCNFKFKNKKLIYIKVATNYSNDIVICDIDY